MVRFYQALDPATDRMAPYGANVPDDRMAPYGANVPDDRMAPYGASAPEDRMATYGANVLDDRMAPYGASASDDQLSQANQPSQEIHKIEKHISKNFQTRPAILYLLIFVRMDDLLQSMVFPLQNITFRRVGDLKILKKQKTIRKHDA